MNCNFRLGVGSAWLVLLAVILSNQGWLRADEAGSGSEKTEVKQVGLERPQTKTIDLPAPSKEILEAMLKLHNDTRARNGLPPLKIHAKLTAAAQRYADYSHRTGRFGHYADGRSPAARISAEGVSYGSWAENMAWGQQSPRDAMNTWLNSSGHHGNILSRHSHVGFGKVGSVWVTVFANCAEPPEEPVALIADAG